MTVHDHTHEHGPQHAPEPDYGVLAGLERYAGRMVEYQTSTGRWALGRAAELAGYDPVLNTFVLAVHDGPLTGAHITDPYAIRLPSGD